MFEMLPETRKQKLQRIAEIAHELDCLQQECLNEVDTEDRFRMLQDIVEEAEDALEEEFGIEA